MREEFEVRTAFVAAAIGLTLASAALAQPVVDRGGRLEPERPEAWAMAYMSASTLFTAPGVVKRREPYSVWARADLAHIPRLSQEQRRVGFNGTKLEDLNKSPVFGRLSLGIALPAGFQAELGWTPPVEIDGARPRHLFGLAVSRNLFESGRWSGSARLFHQRGRVVGDFTCDDDTAGFPPGSPRNPYGCREPSSDTFRIDQTGLELGLARSYLDDRLQGFLSATYTRMSPRTRVRARTFDVIDRSLLKTRVDVPTITLGAGYRPAANWRLTAALAWSMLDVRRPPDPAVRSDDLFSLRMALERGFR